MEIKSEDKRISHFETYGDKKGKAILLLHGLGAELTSWKFQTEEFQKNAFFVIAMDLYGHGKSSDLNTEDLAEWNGQITALLDHLNIEKVIICGVSMGGVIAQNYAVIKPNRILALIVSDSFGELKSLSEKFLGFSQVIGFRIFKLLGQKTFAKAMASAYKEDFAKEAQTYMYEQCLKANFAQLIRARKAINKVDVLDRFGERTFPCLILVGVCFGQIFIDVNKKIARSLRNSKFIELANSMDPSPLVNPAAFNREVLLFLKENFK